MSIKAIETRYKGYRFRSRLEARWAVFFDALGIRYEYEPQGFGIEGWTGIDGEPDEKWCYLPDFFLPDFGTWVEVKGSLDGVSDDYLDMIGWAVDWGGQLPGVGDSIGTTNGLLWLGGIPDHTCCTAGAPLHPIMQHCKGGWVLWAMFTDDGLTIFEMQYAFDNYFDATASAGSEIREHLEQMVYSGNRGWHSTKDACGARVLRAYDAARSARFEHGESPKF